jgi:hypothetical protein
MKSFDKSFNCTIYLIATKSLDRLFNDKMYFVSYQLTKQLTNQLSHIPEDSTLPSSIVTCMSDYRRGLDWRLDLLTTYRSELQVTITLSLISNLYKSLHHTLSVLSLLSLTVSR